MESADKAAIAGGLNVTRPDISQIIALMRVFNQYAMQSIKEKSINVLMDFLYSHLSATLQKLDNSKHACRMGCSFCCTNWVTASIPEILYVLKAIPNDRIAHIRTEIVTATQTTAGKSPEDRRTMVTPCPLLEASTCSIYENRPLVCRTAVSNDAALCERVYFDASIEKISGTFHHYGIKGIYGLALVGALKKAGLTHNYFEYNSALNVAINADTAEIDWLSGKDIFPDVAHDPEGEMFSSSWNQKIYEDAFS